jgi:hypothetical protein
MRFAPWQRASRRRRLRSQSPSRRRPGRSTMGSCLPRCSLRSTPLGIWMFRGRGECWSGSRPRGLRRHRGCGRARRLDCFARRSDFDVTLKPSRCAVGGGGWMASDPMYTAKLSDRAPPVAASALRALHTVDPLARQRRRSPHDRPRCRRRRYRPVCSIERSLPPETPSRTRACRAGVDRLVHGVLRRPAHAAGARSPCRIPVESVAKVLDFEIAKRDAMLS